MISIIQKDNTIHKLTADDFLRYSLDVIKTNNDYPSESIQTLYISLSTQSQYCPYTCGIGLYGASNIKATLSATILASIKRFYTSILLILNSYLEILEKIIYTIKKSIRLPIYPQIIFKNIFKQQYTSAH